jgi:hypothetical protein
MRAPVIGPALLRLRRRLRRSALEPRVMAI